MNVIILTDTCQMFGGIRYYLCGSYYQRKGAKRLHIAVWEYHNGAIPKGFHVHHSDENRHNNQIDNLELLSRREHLSRHAKKATHLDRAIKAAQNAARTWHSTDEGLEFHRMLGHATVERCKKNLVTLTCENCGKSYETWSSVSTRSKFCSKNCKAQARYKRRADFISKICPICGSEFKTDKYKTNSITCSRTCGRKLLSLKPAIQTHSKH